MNKHKELERIASEIGVCKICKKDKIGLPVPGEGSPDAKFVFVGEAPGKTEAETGHPFIGRAGKLLRQLIADAGIQDSEIFITSPVKYLPKHGTPRPEEIAHGRIHLSEQLKIIRPKMVVIMGRVACLAVLDRPCSIGSEHGKMVKVEGVNYFLSYHPAAALHAPKLRPALIEDFKKLKRIAKTL